MRHISKGKAASVYFPTLHGEFFGRRPDGLEASAVTSAQDGPGKVGEVCIDRFGR
jgi:hypothetical protein